MKIGDKVRITPRAWSAYLKENGAPPGKKFNPGVRKIINADAGPVFMLDFPVWWWKAEDLIPAPAEQEPTVTEQEVASITRAFCAVMEMWSRRYDYNTDGVPDAPNEGEPFGAPVLVDLGPLAVAQSELLTAIQYLNPELYERFFKDGGVPDAPLPLAPNITNLDDVRIRVEKEFEDEHVAYVEALWGKSTYAFNAAVRDLEAMRRGQDDGTLRPPVTYYEGMLLVKHVRALANDLARNFGMDHFVREDDDLEEKGG